MQRYKSKYTGPQMEGAFERALPGGAIDAALAGKAAINHNHKNENINPSAVELYGEIYHGGYIDFHYGQSTEDYTSRIIESSKGVVQLNNNKILTSANIIALYSAQITFENGVGNYYNSAIKSSSVCFVQWRAGSVSTLTDSVLSTTSQNGSMIIVAKAGITGGPLPVNILIINQ